MSDVGALIFANNVDNLNYIKLAEFAAAKVERHLNIPVHLVSINQIETKYPLIKLENQRHNGRFLKDFGKTYWLNMGRTQAFNLTPWHKTLVIDADYLIQTDSLKNYLSISNDFSIARELYDPLTGNSFTLKLGTSQIDQCWATVMCFEKTPLAEKIFAMAEIVIENYDYYHRLYNFHPYPLRNDYAFSVACHLMGGYNTRRFDFSNFKLVNCDFETIVEQVNDTNILVSKIKHFRADISRKFLQRIKSDVHVQHKVSLLERLSND